MNSDEYSRISGIQHFVFCPRQWGLIEIDNLWQENLLTVTGSQLHEKVHQIGREKRTGSITVRSMRVKSDQYQIQGQCDAVEFVPDEEGVFMPGYNGRYKVYPVEYKKGKAKSDLSDCLQLVAQTVCLEEMLCCEIPIAYLFYFETRRREEIEITQELREKLQQALSQMFSYRGRNHIPRVKKTKKCDACSLLEQCWPELEALEKASTYMKRRIQE